jgi:hypothetical protein
MTDNTASNALRASLQVLHLYFELRNPRWSLSLSQVTPDVALIQPSFFYKLNHENIYKTDLNIAQNYGSTRYNHLLMNLVSRDYLLIL